MATERFSAIQKQVLKVLIMAFIKHQRLVKSSELNKVVNARLGADIHPNNFRESCKKLSSRGYINRGKPTQAALIEEGFDISGEQNLDWYISLTPKGYELALEWAESEKMLIKR